MQLLRKQILQLAEKIGEPEILRQGINLGDNALGISNFQILYRYYKYPVRRINLFHSQYVMNINFAGEATAFIDDRSLHFIPDNILFIFPFQMHSYIASAHKTRWIVFTFESQMPIPQNLLFTPINFSEQILGIILRIMQGYLNNSTMKISSNLTTLIIELSENCIASSVEREYVNEKIKFISDVNAFIMQNIDRPLCIEEIAETFAISYGHLCATFKNITGTRLGSYIRISKIHYAQNLLSLNKYQIKEVGLMCGFENQSVFYRTFKQITNMSPRQFVQKQSGNISNNAVKNIK